MGRDGAGTLPVIEDSLGVKVEKILSFANGPRYGAAKVVIWEIGQMGRRTAFLPKAIFGCSSG
jgi:hypothetical protein